MDVDAAHLGDGLVGGVGGARARRGLRRSEEAQGRFARALAADGDALRRGGVASCEAGLVPRRSRCGTPEGLMIDRIS